MDAHSVAVIEFQYLVDLLTNTQFYHFYHEHYYYYTVAGFANLAEKAGLEMVTANGWRRRAAASCARWYVKEIGTRMRCTMSAVTQKTIRQNCAFREELL